MGPWSTRRWLVGSLGFLLLQVWVLNLVHDQLGLLQAPNWLTSGTQAGPRRGTPTLPPQPSGTPPRVAVVVPFVGLQLPVTFALFAQSCRASTPLVDWLVVTTGTNVPPADASWVPANVKFIELEVDELARLHAEALVSSQADRAEATALLRELIVRRPYSLVEFKPAIGRIFSELLREYSHWAFGDIDVLMGDLAAWADLDELQGFDIVTYSFGDQFRLYTRGQWTVHKNTHSVNTVFQGCPHLHGELLRRLRRHARYESAEGCYSRVVAQRDDLSVKYTVKAFTDAERQGAEWRTEVVLVDGQVRKARKDPRGMAASELRAFLLPGGLLVRPPLQRPAGEPVEAKLAQRAGCMNWVNPKYQTCMSGDIHGNENLVLLNGTIWRQRFTVRGHLASPSSPTSSVFTSAFFHFQEWKKGYRSWAAQLPNVARWGLLATKTGFIALPPPPEILGPTKNASVAQAAAAGRLVQADQAAALSYCLTSDGSLKCRTRVHWSDFHRMPATNRTSVGSAEDEAVLDVTLLVASDCQRENALSANARQWPGPKTFVLACAQRAWQDLANRGVTVQWQQLGADLLVLQPDLMDSSPPSSAALLNLALDATRTRYALPVLDDGWVAAPGAYRAIKAAYGRASLGTVFALPVFEFAKARQAEPAAPVAVGDLLTGLRSSAVGPFAGRAVRHDEHNSCHRPSAFESHWLRNEQGERVGDMAVAAWLSGTGLPDQPQEQRQRRRLTASRLGLADLVQGRGSSPPTPIGRAASLELGPALALDLATPHGRLMARFVEEMPEGCWQNVFRTALDVLGLSISLLPCPTFLFALTPPTPPADGQSGFLAYDCRCPTHEAADDLRKRYLWHVQRAAKLHRHAAMARSSGA